MRSGRAEAHRRWLVGGEPRFRPGDEVEGDRVARTVVASIVLDRSEPLAIDPRARFVTDRGGRLRRGERISRRTLKMLHDRLAAVTERTHEAPRRRDRTDPRGVSASEEPRRNEPARHRERPKANRDKTYSDKDL